MNDPEPITEAERDFLREVAWSADAGWLTDTPSVIFEVEAAVGQLLYQLRSMHPNRAQRLLLTRVMAARLATEADELLRDMIAGCFDWYQNPDGEWSSTAVQDHERLWLARASGRSPQTIAALVKRVMRETLARAEARADKDKVE